MTKTVTETLTAKTTKAMCDYANTLSPGRAFQYVRTAYAKVVKTTPSPIGDPMLDLLRHHVRLRAIIAWRLAKTFGIVELCDECFDAADSILYLVFIDRADF